MAPTLFCPIPLSEIQAFLRELGVSPRYTGFNLTVSALDLVLTEPDRIQYLIKGVYAEIADMTGGKISSIERNIRTVINQIWHKGNRDLLNKVAGHHLQRKPTNGEFLEMSANYLIEHH